LKVLTLRTCFRDFQGGNETRSVTEEQLFGNDELRASPFIPHKESVRGFIYEVETGRLREVT
jgi:hypothetical protein